MSVRMHRKKSVHMHAPMHCLRKLEHQTDRAEGADARQLLRHVEAATQPVRQVEQRHHRKREAEEPSNV